MNSDLKMLINMLSALGILSGISLCTHQLCNWYGCYSWSYFLRTDMLCNMCTDISYHLKNYHISLYASVATLASYKMTSLINSATVKSDKLLFEK